MPIFIAVPLTPGIIALDEAIEKTIDANDRYKLQSDAGWLFKFEGTTVEASNHIGLTGQAKGESSAIGSALVVPVSGYFGRGPTDMWEWLKTRLEQ